MRGYCIGVTEERAGVRASDVGGAPVVCVLRLVAADARCGEMDETREQGRVVPV